ncbi:MAG: hypothetical protein GMKNLPBB_02941 [Myxococcota bacterium]|nr:hypothetical protein [Myxococcota bacterium]
MARRLKKIWLPSLLAIAIAAMGAANCSSAPQRYNKKDISKAVLKAEVPGLDIGLFTLADEKAILDGDTIRVKELPSTLRLLGVDTEETFKKEHERRDFETLTWDEYLRKNRGGSSKPVKMATPAGEAAKKFADEFFSGHPEVKLERDHPREIRDYYNRYLSYIYAKKDGRWINYNIEVVRAGWSPYFTKYGYSRRFHREFVAAQAEAQAKRAGIWDPSIKHYPDYPERLSWWNRRAEEVKKFEEEMESHPNYVSLTRWDALRQLEQYIGKEVVVFGVVGRIIVRERGPSMVMLSKRAKADFPLVFFDNDVLTSSQIAKYSGEYVRVRGLVNKYQDKYRNTEQLQIVVTLPGQVLEPSTANPVTGAAPSPSEQTP